MSLLLALFFQVSLGGRLEQRTKSVDVVLDAFSETYNEARQTIVPGLQVDLEFPEAELYINDQRAIAYTTWREDCKRFLTRVDWRALYGLEPETRQHIAIHEVCHLRQGEKLKRKNDFSAGERHALEMDAERCVILYQARMAEQDKK